MDLFEAKFVIDGSGQASTLRELIETCSVPGDGPAECIYEGEGIFPETVIDESLDPDITPAEYDREHVRDYVKEIISSGIHGRLGLDPPAEARKAVARALCEAVWTMPAGSRLEGTGIRLEFRWDCRPLGALAALYSTVFSAADYAFELGLRIEGCRIRDLEGERSMAAKVCGSGEATALLPDRESLGRIAGSTIIYIPFDPCDPKLGSSALARLLSATGEECPKMLDPDYLIDCFEIVKELADDRIILAGRSIGDGGLACALERLAEDCATGMDIDLSQYQRAYLCDDIVTALFSEVPGVLIAVSDEDYSYIDSQMLLQDIAYYPVGMAAQPSGIRLRFSQGYNVADILLSIINR